MLNNLLDNADLYGDKQEPVDVHVATKCNEAGAPGVSITVSNRPKFSSWPDPDKVFQKYYRSASAESQPGTGLGLYLVRALARLVGGDCLYLPNDKYVRFELWLPS
jgi:signal transduction histidine kinase